MAGHPSIFGGGKRVFLQIMTFLDKEKFQCYSCCAFNREQEILLTQGDVSIVDIDIQFGGIYASMKKMIKFLRKEQFDIIHSQGARADFYARAAARFSGQKIKIVNTTALLVDTYDAGIFKKYIYYIIDRLFERYVDRFIVVSDVLINALIINHNIPPEKIVKIYNGIELNEYEPHNHSQSSNKIRREFCIDDNLFLIGVVGRMVWEKGFEYLLRGVKDLINNDRNIKILVVGDGPLKEKLQELVATLGITDYVIFTGFRSDVREIMCAIDVLLIPSLAEGFPMVTLEAMAMAKPIIATRIDGITEQISDGKEGLLVPPKDPSALAEAIIKLMGNRELAISLGLAAREKVELEFSVEKMIAETEKVYQSLCRN